MARSRRQRDAREHMSGHHHTPTLDPEFTVGSLATPAAAAASRIAPVDLLRGLVMVIMAIDHVRDFVHAGAMNFPPEDLSRTTAAIFLTRWITHVCAPVFMLCAGLGVWFRMEHRGRRGISSFLVTRGLWLIALEFTVVHLGLFFNASYSLLFLLVFWALGMSMIAMALLVHLRYGVLLAIALSMIALHNLTDAVSAARFGDAA